MRGKTYLTLLLIFLPFITFCSEKAPKSDIIFKDSVKVSQEIKIPPIPKALSFAGEEVPLHYFDVRESLVREITSLTYMHGSMLYIMHLDNRYSREIKSILREEGVPEDLYYICVTESMLQPLVSPARAAGYWQFLAGTAKEYGLEVNDEVDERYNIDKSTRAAAAYFKKAYEEFGSWAMAAASYNTGFKNVRYRIEIQSKNCYYDTQFVEETGRYLFRAIAYKTILNNRALYGFNIAEEELFKELKYKEVEVKGTISNWSDFAAQHGTNFKMIKIFNQWIRANNLTNRARNSYVVRVPLKGFRESY